jgi:hypothetical protein
MLVRVVAFDDSARNQRRFDLYYAAILLGAPKGVRGLEVIRREARVLDALDAISDPLTADAGPGDVARRHVQAGRALLLSQPEFDLLTQYLAGAEWIPIVSRDVVDAADWLSAAPPQREALPATP